MLAYCVDEAGGCRAMQYPTHAHLMQLMRDVALVDHILYYPVDTPAFAVYYHEGGSRMGGTVYIVPLTGAPPATSDLSRACAWARRWSSSHGYPFLTVATLPPTPNQSHNDDRAVRSWCDTQIDAFTFWVQSTQHPRGPPSSGTVVDGCSGPQQRRCKPETESPEEIKGGAGTPHPHRPSPPRTPPGRVTPPTSPTWPRQMEEARAKGGVGRKSRCWWGRRAPRHATRQEPGPAIHDSRPPRMPGTSANWRS